MKKLKRQPKTIRVIEWDCADQKKTALDLPDPTIYPDSHQVLEWVFRQALIDFGFRVGFEKTVSKIRVNFFESSEKYVEAILGEIEKQEKQRLKRFQKAIEYYDYYHEEEDPSPSDIAKFHEQIGVSGKNAAIWGQFLEVDRPLNCLRFGFEQLYYPLLPTLMDIHRTLKELNRGSSEMGSIISV